LQENPISPEKLSVILTVQKSWHWCA